MTRKIKLTKNKFAVIDDRDYERVSRYGWWTLKLKNNKFYAARNDRDKNGKRITVLLHRFILSAPANKQVDHIDNDGLNCTRKNIRVCTPSQNRCNIKIKSNNTSGYKGVTFSKRSGKWDTHIQIKGRRIYIKRFDNPIDAAKAYDQAAKKYHGKFAHLNFPQNKKPPKTWSLWAANR